MQFNATAGADYAANAVTDSATITGNIQIAAAQSGMAMGDADVEIVVSCGDSVCSPGEPKVKGQADTAKTCVQDCPVVIGECDAPPESGVGNSTLQCGGKGTCNPANLLCDCYVGYAVHSSYQSAILQSSIQLVLHAQLHATSARAPLLSLCL